jgi:L,D-transpeptidase ErfK/SrfK
MLKKIILKYIVLSFFLLIQSISIAAVYVIPSNGNVVGEVQRASSDVNETIDDVGRRFGLGYYEMVHANPQADAHHTLIAGSSLVLPSQFILPSAPLEGIVINLAEYRLYYFPPGENVVMTFPVGIGKKGWSTPIGATHVTSKVTHPTWRPTAKVLAAAENIGAALPDTFPPGPNNPLGNYALRLGWPTFLIHGTNRTEGIGTRVSAGCIRMLPDDIEYLYHNVKVGTKVRVINEPVKIGHMGGAVVLQMHPSTNLKTILFKKLKVLGREIRNH